MPRSRGTMLIEFRATGIRRMERLTRTWDRLARQAIQAVVEETGEAAVNTLRSRAPSRTGRLAEHIEVVGQNRSSSRPSIRVGVDVRDPVSGFPYLNVTRFGRRAVEAKRRPKPARSYRVPQRGAQRLRSGGTVNPFRAAMLRFEPGPPGSGFILKRRVRAYHPQRDWVRAAESHLKRLADDIGELVGDELQEAYERAVFAGVAQPNFRAGGTRRTRLLISSRSGRLR